MREAHLRYLLAAALVVVAGYGVYTAAPQGGESPAVSTPPTGTPTPVLTTEGPSDVLAPGLTWEGVVDPWNLSHAHANVLSNTSYSTSSASVRWTTNGSYASRSVGYVRVAEGGRPFHARFGSAGDERTGRFEPDVEIWAETNTSYVRYGSGNGTHYRKTGASQDPFRGSVTNWDTIYSRFSGVNTTTVEEIAQNGTIRYRVVSTSQPAPKLFSHRRSNYSLSTLVGPDGLVYRYQESFDLHGGDRTIHVTQTWRLSNVGSTTVSEPGWVETARNATAGQE